MTIFLILINITGIFCMYKGYTDDKWLTKSIIHWVIGILSIAITVLTFVGLLGYLCIYIEKNFTL